MIYSQFFSLFIFGITISISGPLLDAMEKSFDVNSAQTGLLFTFFSAGFLLSVLLQYFLSAKISVIKSGLIGQFFLAFSLFAFSWNQSFWGALLIYTFAGAAGGALQISANAIVSEFSGQRRAFFLNILHLCFGTGALSGPLIASVVVDQNISWRFVYMINAIGAVLATLWIWLASGQTVEEKFESPVYDGKQANKSDSWADVFKEPVIWLVAVSILLYVGVEMAINSWAVIYIQETTTLNALAAGAGVSYFWAAMTFGRLLSAYLSKYVNPVLLVSILALLAVVSYVLFITADQNLQVLLWLTAVGFAFSGLFPLYLGLAGSVFPDKIPQITAIGMSSLGIGFMIFPVLVGAIRQNADIFVAMQSLIIPLIFMVFLSIPLIFRSKKYSDSSTMHEV